MQTKLIRRVHTRGFPRGSRWTSSAGLTSKKRQKLVAEESHHMLQVLQHPAFVANPFAALQEHLKNTVGAMHMDRAERHR